MIKYKKFKNEELLICIEDTTHNAIHHPTEEGREFSRERVLEIEKEIRKRIELDEFDEIKARLSLAYKLHTKNKINFRRRVVLGNDAIYSDLEFLNLFKDNLLLNDKGE